MTAFPKTAYVRSQALMRAYREIPCQACGTSDGSVCGAHSNQAVHGKGRSLKASDVYAASLCHRCHTELDQGAFLSREARRQMWQRAHERTVQELVRQKLWPAAVPLPERFVELMESF
ncbi:MAG: hypothetical protein H0W48_00125 [Methylibium sp.]|nr:hypothetical protein [Methylibium sp.]